ncbi:MAG: hypothetical protein M3O03_06085 [Pseudomonadota bacterium]|nr:hypothetical protein [Pseudomonadota bacterium]
MAKDYGRLVHAMRDATFIDANGAKKNISVLVADKFKRRTISCEFLADAIFYYQHKSLIDNFDTSPFHKEYNDVLTGKDDTTIPTDPRKVVIEIKYYRSIKTSEMSFYPEQIARSTFATSGAGAGVCKQYLKIVGLLRSN